MTKNQIEYAKLLETTRANKAQESLTKRRDEAAKVLGLNTLAETSRHNLAGERISLGTLDETARSNQARERETARSNLAREAEAERANRAREVETERSNKARESETALHNRATEVVDTARAANEVARTVETGRHNLAMELKDMSPKVITTVTQDTSSPSATPTEVIDLEPVPKGLVPKAGGNFSQGFGRDSQGAYYSYRGTDGEWHRFRQGPDGLYYED